MSPEQETLVSRLVRAGDLFAGDRKSAVILDALEYLVRNTPPVEVSDSILPGMEHDT